MKLMGLPVRDLKAFDFKDGKPDLQKLRESSRLKKSTTSAVIHRSFSEKLMPKATVLLAEESAGHVGELQLARRNSWLPCTGHLSPNGVFSYVSPSLPSLTLTHRSRIVAIRAGKAPIKLAVDVTLSMVTNTQCQKRKRYSFTIDRKGAAPLLFLVSTVARLYYWLMALQVRLIILLITYRKLTLA